jgi:hypothetical protein
MSKKDFKGGIDGLLGGKNSVQSAESKGRPAITKTVITTLLTNAETLQKIRGIAYWDRVSIKEVLNDALNQYIDKYESTKGVVKLVSSKEEAPQ